MHAVEMDMEKTESKESRGGRERYSREGIRVGREVGAERRRNIGLE